MAYLIHFTRIGRFLSSLRPCAFAALPARPTRTIPSADAPVLVWVVAGTAVATLDSGPRTLRAGAALWLPAGHRAAVRGAAGSCVLPIRIRAADRAAGPSEPITVTVPLPAHDALLAAFARSLGVLHGGGVRAAMILSWINAPTGGVQAPAMPRSPDLLRVAEALLADPERSPAEAGARHGLSTSVLARRFRAETGWTPIRWRSRAVLADAAERIRLRGSVAAGITSTGYGSPQAFSRAFRREWGFAPGALLADAPARALVGRRRAALGPQRNAYHVVLWVAAGTAQVGIDDTVTRARAGDIVCLPAGAFVSYRADPDSVVLPIGWLPGGADLAPGVVAHVGADAREPLIRLAAWSYADVQQAGPDTARQSLQSALGIDEPQDIAPEIAAVIYRILGQLAEQPEDGRSSEDLAAEVRLDPAELRRAVEALTGTSLAVWRARTRMMRARRMLRDGMHASQVARRVGYADAAGFSRAFRRAHGRTPSRFLAEELRALSA